MIQYLHDFQAYFSIKSIPSQYEKELFIYTQKYIRYIAWIPWIRMIAVVNSLAMFATDESSDIDLFIITTPWMMWFVRFFTTLIFHILWVRRYGKYVQKRFCLSFFITENSLNFNSILIEDDVYMYYWIYYMKPILNYNDTYEKFLSENNWVSMPHEMQVQNWEYCIYNKRQISPPLKIFIWFDVCIRWCIQWRTIQSSRKLWDPYGIVIQNDMLKFHTHDIRIKTRNELLFKK